jgi:hypothetical protein
VSRWRNPLARLLVTLTTMSAASLDGGQRRSSWIAVCTAAQAAADGLPYLTDDTPDRAGRRIVVVRSAPSHCSATPLPIESADVLWARLVPSAVTNRLQRGFLLQGGDALPSVSSEIIPVDEAVSTWAQSPAAVRSPRRSIAASPLPTRAMWAWRRELWQSSASSLFSEAAAWNVGVIYIAVTVGDDGRIADAERLRAFLMEAAERGIQVWAVEGDPRAVVGAERTVIARRARAIASFNATPGPRFTGIQYDIEPYLNPGYAVNEGHWNEAYIATIEHLKKAADLPVEIAVPFWWREARAGATTLMDRVARWIDSVAVMDYRTDPDAIERFARPWLEWGEHHNRRIRIALEAGPLPDEPRHHFRPARSGTLWMIEVGDARALVLLRAPQPNSSGAAFALVSRSTSDASRITFFGRLDRLRAILPDLERRLAAYPSFAGIALHEVVR